MTVIVYFMKTWRRKPLGGSQELYPTMYFVGLTATALDPVQKESI